MSNNEDPTVRAAFDAAFVALQSSLKPLPRNAAGDDGPYADIESIWTHIRPKLKRHGFYIIQSEGAGECETVIRHRSGWTMRYAVKTEPSSSGPNRYGRRHALMCLLGLVEEPAKPAELKYRLIGYTVSQKLHDAIAGIGLSVAQLRVLLNSGKSDDEMIDEAVRLAEAQRLGGAK